MWECQSGVKSSSIFKFKQIKQVLAIFCIKPNDKLPSQYLLLQTRHTHWITEYLQSCDQTGANTMSFLNKRKKNSDLEKCDAHDQRIIRLNFYERWTRFLFDFDLFRLWDWIHPAGELRSQWAGQLDSDGYWLQRHEYEWLVLTSRTTETKAATMTDTVLALGVFICSVPAFNESGGLE